MRLVHLLALAVVVAGCFLTSAPESVATRDGVRLEIELDRVSAMVGDRVTAHVRLSNGNRQLFRSLSGGVGQDPFPVCDGPLVEALAPPPSPGRTWEGNAALFKATLLSRTAAPEPVYQFKPPDLLDREVGCAIMDHTVPFRPGQVEEFEVAWEVQAPPGLSPTAQLTVQASFRYSADQNFQPWMTLVVQTTLDVFGQDGDARPTRVDYVDAALSAPMFRRFIDSLPPREIIDSCCLSLSLWPNEAGDMPPDEPYAQAQSGAATITISTGEARADVILERSTAEVLGVLCCAPDDRLPRFPGPPVRDFPDGPKPRRTGPN